MSTLIGALQAINLFCAAIVAGIMVAVLFGVIPSLQKFTMADDLRFHQSLDPRMDAFQPILVVGAGISSIVLLILDHDSALATACLLLGLACTIGIIVASAGFNQPVNRRCQEWTAETLPADYPAIRERWNRIHLLRTISAVVALISFIIAALL